MVTEKSPQSEKLSIDDYLNYINVANFTQEELHSLSLASSNAFDLNNIDDVVVPVIDKNVFNECPGSRVQIVDRYRPLKTGPRRPRPRRRYSSNSNDSQYNVEDKSILNCLKNLIDGNQENLNFVNDENNGCEESNASGKEIIVVDDGEESDRNRKKGSDISWEICEGEFDVLNVKGVAIDLVVLENGDKLFEGELRKWTFWVEKKEDGLGFFRGLLGNWCSRRRERRIIDASMIGEWLPVGWKLVLDLRCQEGRWSVYIHKFMSPSGLQFPSCKEVASYLKSHYGSRDSALIPIDQDIDGVQHTSNTESGNISGDVNGSINSNSPVRSSLLSEEHGDEVNLLDLDNLPDVQVNETFECRKCGMDFDEMETYLKHVVSVHPKKTRRFDFNSSAGEDTSAQKSQELLCQETVQTVASETAKMDTVFQVVENSVSATTSADSAEHVDKLNNGWKSLHKFLGGDIIDPQQHIDKAGKSKTHHFTTECVWCRKPFKHVVIDVEKLPEDITGFMCPKCKHKICGNM